MTASPQPDPTRQPKDDALRPPQSTPSHEREDALKQLGLKLEFLLMEFLQHHGSWVPPLVMDSPKVQEIMNRAKAGCEAIVNDARQGSITQVGDPPGKVLEADQVRLGKLCQEASSFCSNAGPRKGEDAARGVLADNAGSIKTRLGGVLKGLHIAMRDALQDAITAHVNAGTIELLIEGCILPEQYMPLIVRGVLSKFSGNGVTSVILYMQEDLPRWLENDSASRSFRRRQHYYLGKLAPDEVVGFVDSAIAAIPASGMTRHFESIGALGQEVPGIRLPKGGSGLVASLFPVQISAKVIGYLVVLHSERNGLGGERTTGIKALVGDLEHHIARLLRGCETSPEIWVE